MKGVLCLDLYCGLGGWAEGFLSEGYRVIGFDTVAHDYGTGGYPGELVLRDVRSINGAELIREYGIPALIVASPPCIEYSYMAMPWSRSKQIARALRMADSWAGEPEFPEGYTGSRSITELNWLFDACFKLQREASEAADRYIPLIVENVRGAQKWVGRAKANFGSFYLWGDVGMVGNRVVPIVDGRLTFGIRPIKAAKVPGFRFDGNGGSFQTASVEAQKRNPDGTDHGSGSWFKIADSKNRGAQKTPAGNCSAVLWKDREIARYAHPTPEEFEKHGFTKVPGISFNGEKGRGSARNMSSKSDSRKAASALIAKIPFRLAQHIARTFKPEVREEAMA